MSTAFIIPSLKAGVKQNILEISNSTNKGMLIVPRWRGKYFNHKHFTSWGDMDGADIFRSTPFRLFTGIVDPAPLSI